MNKRKKHGLSNTKLHNVWIGIIKRCYKEYHKSYPQYGGRGIVMCDEWKNDFLSFYNWAIENGYTEGLTIDRIDVNGIYEPSNCRWANAKEQGRNKRNNFLIEINGEEKTLSEWSELSGVIETTLRRRYEKGIKGEKLLEKTNEPNKRVFIKINGESDTLRGWEKRTGICRRVIKRRYDNGIRGKELFEPVKERQLIEIKGEIKTISEWSVISGVSIDTLCKRIEYGWKEEELLQPVKDKKEKVLIEIDGEINNLSQWEKKTGVCRHVIKRRYDKGIRGKDLLMPINRKTS